MQETKEESKEQSIEDLVADAKGYVSARMEYLRLYAIEKGAKVFADLVTNLAVVVSFILAFLFGSITLALYLSTVLGSYAGGFGCVALIYILLAIVVYITKDTFLERAITDFAIKRYFNKLQEEEEEEDEKV
ncbi:hypothetical protein ABIB40_002329 [Pedobacter sp. UYP30]|uniref:phage holin family protein n=1 Tax=Pedobacter sp. UYP30 TaxID=1756400 RepID=UPI003391501A